MYRNMKNNILRIGFSRLAKEDVKSLAARVITIVEGNDPETLKIKEIYDLLVELQPQIDALRLRHLAHPITEELEALRRQRIAFAQGIIDKVKTTEYGKISGKEEAIKFAKPLILQHLQGLSNMTEEKILDNIKGFMHLQNNDLQLSTAVENLELNPYLDNLQHLNLTIEGLYITRNKNVSARPKKITPGIVALIKEALEDLFKQIEVAQVKNQELDYKPLVDELNNVIALLRAKIKARASYNKKKAEKEHNANNGVVRHGEMIAMSSSEEPSASTQSTERMYPTDVEVDNNEENLEQLDIKKTVAVSGKQTRLPIVSDEA